MNIIQKQLEELALKGFKEQYLAQETSNQYLDVSFDDRLAMLLESEKNFRSNQRRDRLLRAAKLRVSARPEEIEFSADRNINKDLVKRLLTCEWIERAQNVLVTGKTGTGKTWLSCCFGTQSARLGLPVLYTLTSRLLEEFEITRKAGDLHKLRSKLRRNKLLILDDFGLSPLKAASRYDLLDILEDRVGVSSTIVCGQMPVEHWHGYIGDEAIADAILDRLVSGAHRIQLEGDSKRRT